MNLLITRNYTSNKKLFFLILCIPFLLVACRTSNEALRKKDLWSLELNNGGCLDVCKSYSIDILSDGTYHYKGTHNVKHIGKREGVFTQKQMKTYRELLGVIHWNELNDSYGSAANDSQLKEITFTLDSLTKRVLIYRLEPLELREVIRYIDELIDNDDF